MQSRVKLCSPKEMCLLEWVGIWWESEFAGFPIVVLYICTWWESEFAGLPTVVLYICTWWGGLKDHMR